MRNVTLLLFCFVVFIVCGCSGVANHDVIAPRSDNFGAIVDSQNPLALMVERATSDGFPKSGSGVMGFFEVSVDKSTMNGEMIPLRSVALDDVLEMVDITNFLRLAPCADCAKLMGIERDIDGNIILKIGIKHPFAVGDPYKPITGKNRADLHVFNVEGTVIFDNSSGSTNFNSLGASVAPSYLVNADGYSPYLDFALDAVYPTTASAHPYILHFDDYSQGNFNALNAMGFESVTTPPPSGNLVMAMGCDYDIKDYKFRIPDNESFNFMFAVGCTYAVSSANKSMRFSPEYQIPQHNKKAASEVIVEIAQNDLGAGNTSSSAQLLIKVLDINHGVAVGNALNEMLADSSVESIFVEVSGVTSGTVGGAAVPTGGDGRDPSNPLTFNLMFQNSLGAGGGIYRGLVKILDSYSTGQNTSPLLSGMDAIKAVDPLSNPLTGLYSLPEFATYMTFDIEIGANHPPIASFTTMPEGTPDLSIGQYSTVHFTSTSYDPDDPATPEGQIVLYEWDFEWDGITANFVDDTSGMGTDIESHRYETQGLFHAGLRVTDGGTPPAQSNIYSILIDVSEASCGDQVHEWVGTYNVTGVLFGSSVFMGDIGYFRAGPNAGKVVSQYGYGRFGLIDPDDSNQTMIPFNPSALNATNFYPTIDTCPATGRLFTALTSNGSVYSPTGASLGNWSDLGGIINAVEIDDDGDLWVMMRVGSSVYLREYLYSDTAPYYQIPAERETDLTSYYPPSSYWVCADLAMDFQTQKMFLFMARYSIGEHRIAVFDVSGPTATRLVERSNVFSANISIMIGGDPLPYYGRRADIEIDHTNPEYCRVVVGACTTYSTVYRYELVRLDDQLNTIDFDDSFRSLPGGSFNDMPQAFTIAETGSHPIIATPMYPDKFLYFDSSNW